MLQQGQSSFLPSAADGKTANFFYLSSASSAILLSAAAAACLSACSQACLPATLEASLRQRQQGAGAAGGGTAAAAASPQQSSQHARRSAAQEGGGSSGLRALRLSSFTLPAIILVGRRGCRRRCCCCCCCCFRLSCYASQIPRCSQWSRSTHPPSLEPWALPPRPPCRLMAGSQQRQRRLPKKSCSGNFIIRNSYQTGSQKIQKDGFLHHRRMEKIRILGLAEPLLLFLVRERCAPLATKDLWIGGTSLTFFDALRLTD
jgi:hypothetical protein